MANKLEQALELAEQGFYVFPLKKNGKTPAHEGWQQEATFNADEVTALFDNSKDYNIGIFTGHYFKFAGHVSADVALVVVDVDTKDGKQGTQTMIEHDVLGNDFPPTLEFETASGGRHLVYFYDFPLSGGANKLGLHVDVKSYGGYIVGAGSTVDGKPYKATNNEPIAYCPAWIVERLGRPMDRNPVDQAIEVLDADSAISRGRDYVTNTAPTAAPGKRNDTAYRVACKLHDFGLSEPMAQEMMFTWNTLHCHPHLDIEEVEAVTASAYKTAKLPAGHDSADAEFEAAADDELSDKPKPPKLFYRWFDEIEHAPDAHPLLEDYLDQGAMSVLYGESNSGKTFVAMDIAFHVAAGLPWNGKRTSQGSILYLAAEGGRGAQNRVLALKKKHKPHQLPFALAPCAANLFDSSADLKAVIGLIRAAQRQSNQPIKLVIIDTLSRVLAGGNENSSEDMTLFIENIDTIRRATTAHVMIVHHSGKDTSKGARGHSSLRAATDTELEIVDRTVLVRKQRDMEFAKPIGFELDTLTVGTNAYGEDITSCTVNYVDAEAREAFLAANRLEHRDLIALLAIQSMRTGRSIANYENVVDQKEWKKRCEDFDITLVPGAKPWPTSNDSFLKAFARARERLVGFGRVVELEEKQWALVETGQAVR